MSKNIEPKFGKFRSFFWPIQFSELKKLIPMFFLFFFFSLTYMLLKDTKEPLIVTAPGSGAEAIPFLKMWGTLPLAFLFMIIYSKLSNIMSKKKLFYCVITMFISFYALFGFVLYPLRDVLHPTEFADYLQSVLPVGFNGLIAIIRNWTYSLFYAMSELWGSVGISLLFWGFANDITKVCESKRFYSLFGLGSSLAMLVSGPTIMYLANIRKRLPEHVDAWGVSLAAIVGVIFVCGLLIMGLYSWINKYVLTDPKFFIPSQNKILKKNKLKMSLREALGFITRSKYLLLLAVLVAGYAIANSFIEIVWKTQLKQQFPNPNDYTAFRGLYSTVVSILTIFMMLFVGGNVIRRLGWKFAALVTPVVILLSGFGFFSFIIWSDQLNLVANMIGFTPLILAIILGSIPNLMCKACKYSLFEPTKEMAYIPLDQEAKSKGKAAIDVLVAKIGKAGGMFVLQALLIVFGSVIACTPYIALLLFGIIICWILAASKLSKRFLEKQKSQDSIEDLEEETNETKVAI